MSENDTVVDLSHLGLFTCSSWQEAEEYMKLLGTHQQHGRVFARLAYDSEQVCWLLGPFKPS